MRVTYVVLVVLLLGAGLYGFLTWVDRTDASPEVALATANICLGAALVLATLLLVDEGRRMRESSFAPSVSVTVGPLPQVAKIHELRIQNNGRGSAHDVSFELFGDLNTRGGSKLSEARVVQEGIRFLEPGGTYRTVVGGEGFYAENAPDEDGMVTAVKVLARYKNDAGKRYQSVSWIELREYLLATPVDKEVSESLKATSEALRKIASWR